MTFRAIAAADIDVVLGMVQKLYARETLSYDRERHRRAMEDLLAHPEHGGAWLMEADGVPAGYFVITNGYSLEFGGRFALLDELFVEEAWRGRGLGTRALEFMEEWCARQGISALRLEVAHDNLRALALYQRSGFRVQDRHFMTRILTGLQSTHC